MQIVIDIEDNYYYGLQFSKKHYPNELRYFETAIANGTPLSKGHGRLIDVDELIKRYNFDEATKYGNKNAKQQAHSYSTMMLYEIADMIDDAPTIIEADKGDKE